jgi:hypothetical protein
MNIHLPAILMFTTGVQGFDTLPYIDFQGGAQRHQLKLHVTFTRHGETFVADASEAQPLRIALLMT